VCFPLRELDCLVLYSMTVSVDQLKYLCVH
jgi:hypothetical protein